MFLLIFQLSRAIKTIFTHILQQKSDPKLCHDSSSNSFVVHSYTMRVRGLDRDKVHIETRIYIYYFYFRNIPVFLNYL